MVKFLTPSPVLLDQSFPRSKDDLLSVAISLSEIQTLLDTGKVYLLLPAAFKDWIEQVDWNPPRDYALLTDIYKYLTLLFLMPHNSVLTPILEDVESVPHPLPTNVSKEVWSDVWATEMGHLLRVHDAQVKDDEYFLGLACSQGFSGASCASYNEDVERAFPHVGPESLENLAKPYQYVTSQDVTRKEVSFALAKKNYKAIGAESVNEAKGTSHYKVNFEGRRCWTLDKNVDPVPDDFLAELVPITGLPLLVVKEALITGVPPAKVSRIPLIYDPF